MKRTAILLLCNLVAAIGLVGAAAPQGFRQPAYFVFMESARVGGYDALYVGWYHLFSNGSCQATFRVYNADSGNGGNLPGTDSKVRYPAEMCPNGAANGDVIFPTPANWNPKPVVGKWSLKGDVLTTVVGKKKQVWQPQSFTTVDGRDRHYYEQTFKWSKQWCKGYGFATDRLVLPPLSRNDFLGQYNGPYYYTLGGAWQVEPFQESLNPGNMTVAKESKDVWWHASVDGKDNLAVYGAVVLNHDPEKWSIFYSGVGHDFNNDQAANDMGHTVIYVPSVDPVSGKVDTLLVGECSWGMYGYSLTGIGVYTGF